MRGIFVLRIIFFCVSSCKKNVIIKGLFPCDFFEVTKHVKLLFILSNFAVSFKRKKNFI